jgi:Domain of unknown function (DUF5666)
MTVKRIPLLGIFLALGLASAPAQPQERMARDFPDNVVGKVTSVGKDSLVVAPLMGGDPVTIKVGDNTRVTKDRQPYKLQDIKTDEIVFARGSLKSNVMEAGVVGVANPQMVQRFEQGGGPGGPGGGRGGFMMGPGMGGNFKPEDLGKTFIMGEVKAINETKLTIARPDGQSQDIEVDENTSFKKGNESITLPDIKAGDFVRGTGELKNGVFFAKELSVPRVMRRIVTGGEGTPAPPPQPEQNRLSPGTPAPQNPPADKPSTPPPPKEFIQ